MGETLSQRVCRQLSIQACCDKRLFEHLVRCLSVHWDCAFFVSRREQWTGGRYPAVFLSVPSNEIVNCASAIGIHGHSSGDLATLYNQLFKEKIGHRFAVLVNVPDLKRLYR